MILQADATERFILTYRAPTLLLHSSTHLPHSPTSAKLTFIQFPRCLKSFPNVQFLFGSLVRIFFFFSPSRAKCRTYGNSQARGQIRAIAACLCHSNSNARSEPCLRPTPQLTATLDP